MRRLSLMLAAATLLAGAACSGDPGTVVGSLKVSPGYISLTTTQPSAVLTLINEVDEDASFDLVTAADWLTVDPAAGVIDRGRRLSVMVRASSYGHRSNETLKTEITVRAPGGDGKVTVEFATVTVAQASGPATLVLTSPADLSLSASETEGQIGIANGGAGELSWSAKPSAAWLEVAPSGGKLAGGKATVLKLRVHRAGLPRGTSTGEIAFTSDGGKALVRVSAVVEPAPILSVVTPGVAFAVGSHGISTRTFTLANVGQEPLTFTATDDRDYLNLPNGAGTIPPGARTAVTIEFDHDAAYDGKRRGSVVVSSNGGSGEIVVTGDTDASPPFVPRNPDGSVLHLHDGKRFRHIKANIIDRGVGVARARLHFQTCSGVAHSGQSATCDDVRTVTMRHTSGTTWITEAGPLASCKPGISSYLAFRLTTADKLDNEGLNPGSSTYFFASHCKT